MAGVASPRVRQLLPTVDGAAVDDVDPVAAYAADDRPTPDDRPWVMVNMVASTDGATAVDGRSGALGGPADKRVFAAVRAVADVVLVAAGTVRAERYGPPRPSDVVRAQRRSRGQSEAPRVAIVTRRLDLDLDTALFTGAEAPPFVIVPESTAADRLAPVQERAHVVRAGARDVSLPIALRALFAEGARIVLVEGGPSLNGTVVADDLVDELCLTLSPLLVSGDSARIAHGDRSVTERLRLRRILEEDDLLFLRYTR